VPYDINDPYRQLFATEGDPDAERLFGPRVLDQYTAEERELLAREEQEALRESHGEEIPAEED